MPDNAHIESFFTDLCDTHVSGVGVKETSYYPYLSNLLNVIGKKLKPKVRCIIHPRSIGAGLPDGALITTDQKSKADDPLADGLIPSRGVIEIKAPDEDVQAVVGSDQVAKYLSKYGLVVVTNLREFVIVARVQGQPTQLEAFTLAPSEKAFWKAVGNPRKLTEAIGDSFNEYLTRVLLQAAPLTAPKEVAWFLASYARDAKARIEGQAHLPGLATLKPVYDTLVKAKIPFPRQTAYFVSAVEFIGGSLVTVGLLSSPACAVLLIDMIVAILTESLSTLPKGLSPLSWLDDFLYLPEVLYVLFFIWLICSGPGKFSVDYWLAGKLLS